MRHITVACPVASRRPFFVRAMAIIVVVVASYGLLQAQKTGWTQYGSGPVLDVGPAGSWDDGTVMEPCVIKDGDTLRMWYTGVDNSIDVGITSIGYAWSTDGTSWTRHAGNPVLPRSTSGWDNGHTLGAEVLKDGDTLKMWYGGIPSGQGAAPGPDQGVGYATSVDGINWNRLSSPVLQAGAAGEWDHDIFTLGNVIKDGSVYKMWYTGGTGAFFYNYAHTISIGYATSTDGINWTKYNDSTTTDPQYQFSDPVLQHGLYPENDYQRAWNAWVMKTNTGYQMWYVGGTTSLQAIMYATSPDGIKWTKTPTPVFQGSGWIAIISPCVILKDNQYCMWFSGFLSWVVLKIGYATAPVTSVREGGSDIPLAFGLAQNYPNPFNPATKIQFSIVNRQLTIVKVYDVLGREVATLVNEVKEPGTYTVQFDGAGLSSGVYLCRLEAGSFAQTRKLVLLR